MKTHSGEQGKHADRAEKEKMAFAKPPCAVRYTLPQIFYHVWILSKQVIASKNLLFNIRNYEVFDIYLTVANC